MYQTPSLGYTQEGAGTSCVAPRGRLWLSLRCVVDVCGDRCRYNLSMSSLPYELDDADVVVAPIEVGSWQYYRVAVAGYDILSLSLERLPEYGSTPEYRLFYPPSPPPPPPLPSSPDINATSSSTATAAPSAPSAAPSVTNSSTNSSSNSSNASAGRRLQAMPQLALTQHGLVGTGVVRKRLCPTASLNELQMPVDLNAPTATTGLFCTEASDAADMYVGVYAELGYNNVSLPPRHWYRLAVSHQVFDTTALASASPRQGCLSFGQWRYFTITTSTGETDTTFDAEVDVPVSAIYARRDAVPTSAAGGYDAVALWPLQVTAAPRTDDNVITTCVLCDCTVFAVRLRCDCCVITL